MKKFYAFILFLIGLIIVITWNRKQAADEIIKSVRVVDNSIIPTDSNVMYFQLDSSISTSLDWLNKFATATPSFRFRTKTQISFSIAWLLEAK